MASRASSDFVVPDDEVLDGIREAADGLRRERRRRRRASARNPSIAGHRRCSDRRRSLAGAVEVGDADRGVGRDRRRLRSAGIAASTGSTTNIVVKIQAESREDPESSRVERIERDRRNLLPPAHVRAADHRRTCGVAERGDVGRVAGPLCGAGAARAALARARAARRQRAAADERHRSGLARRGARRHRRAPAAARERAAEVTIRTRVRRRSAAGARPHLQRRLRRRDSPSGCSRRSRTKIR